MLIIILFFIFLLSDHSLQSTSSSIKAGKQKPTMTQQIRSVCFRGIITPRALRSVCVIVWNSPIHPFLCRSRTYNPPFMNGQHRLYTEHKTVRISNLCQMFSSIFPRIFTALSVDYPWLTISYEQSGFNDTRWTIAFPD